MSGLVFYVILVVSLFQYSATRDDMYLSSAWACLILAQIARLEDRIKRGERK